jgi:glycosyltransferase involved in cell wall biosynthesis
MERRPSVSVVVATRNRHDRLSSLLESLRRQTIDDFELIVVDDGSSDATPELLLAEEARGELSLRVIRNEIAGGPARARNAGWRAGTGALVAFTDDDCEAEPGWLEGGLRAWDGRGDRIVQGLVQPIARERDGFGPLSYSIFVESESDNFETANIMYPRDLLERLGGFDDAFPNPSGEDADLGWRALALGAERVFAPDAAVAHAVVQLSPRQMARRLWQWSDAIRPYADHPELRARLHLGLFWNWSHYLLLRAILALPFLRRRWGWPLAAWLGGRYVAYQMERSRKYTGSARWAPGWVARDVVETAAVIRGALRYGVRVL